MLADLLVSEGARRRVRLEIERSESEGDVLDVADLFRQRLAQDDEGGIERPLEEGRHGAE